jgi:transposase
MPPDRLGAQERVFLGHRGEFAPNVIRAGELANAFAALETWMSMARSSSLDSFVHGLERDTDAVAAAIGTSWSSGPVEGQITRLKAIKRSAYGRAGFPLRRQRGLMAA